jgi:hypothetical protein
MGADLMAIRMRYMRDERDMSGSVTLEAPAGELALLNNLAIMLKLQPGVEMDGEAVAPAPEEPPPGGEG